MPLHSDLKDQRRNGKILIVDDDKHFRKLIQAMLTKAGYHVLESENGRAAIELLRTRTSLHSAGVDMILCDIRMPELDGLEAIAAFRRDFPEIPVVVLTGFPDIEMAAALLKKGVTNYSLKPIEREKLLAVVDRVLDQKYALKTLKA